MNLQVGDKLYCKKSIPMFGVFKDRIYEISHIKDDFKDYHIRLIYQNDYVWITNEQLEFFYTPEELRLLKLESL